MCEDSSLSFFSPSSSCASSFLMPQVSENVMVCQESPNIPSDLLICQKDTQDPVLIFMVTVYYSKMTIIPFIITQNE